MDKKVVAKKMFLYGNTLKEISEMIDVNYDRVKQWSSRGNWKLLQVTNHESDNKVGRKSNYYTYIKPKLHLVEKWKAQGLSEKQIIKKLNSNHQSWINYKKQFIELREKLKNGTDIYNKLLEDEVNRVENTLYQKATGDYVEEIEVVNYDKNGKIVNDYKTGIAKTVTRHKKVDTTANIFILKNRKADKYNK